MWEAFQADIERGGGQVLCRTAVTQLQRKGDRIVTLHLEEQNPHGDAEPTVREIAADHVISSTSLKALIELIDPPPPEQVRIAASSLKYRAFIIVGLIIKQADLFPDNWIYIHEPTAQVGRIQNFKNWSARWFPTPLLRVWAWSISATKEMTCGSCRMLI